MKPILKKRVRETEVTIKLGDLEDCILAALELKEAENFSDMLQELLHEVIHERIMKSIISFEGVLKVLEPLVKDEEEKEEEEKEEEKESDADFANFISNLAKILTKEKGNKYGKR